VIRCEAGEQEFSVREGSLFHDSVSVMPPMLAPLLETHFHIMTVIFDRVLYISILPPLASVS